MVFYSISIEQFFWNNVLAYEIFLNLPLFHFENHVQLLFQQRRENYLPLSLDGASGATGFLKRLLRGIASRASC